MQVVILQRICFLNKQKKKIGADVYLLVKTVGEKKIDEYMEEVSFNIMRNLKNSIVSMV